MKFFIKNMTMKKQLKLVKKIVDDFEKVKTKEFMKLFYDFIKFFNKYFDDEAKKYINELKDNKDIKKSNNSKITEKLIEKLSAIVLLWQLEQESKSKKELESIWVTLDIWISNKYQLEYAKTRAWELISEVDETTQKEISKIIEYWISKWNTLQEIAKKIDEKFLKYSTYRSSLIAVMEVWNAYESWSRKQHDEYTKHFWVTWYKKSITQWDSNARETHIINEEAWWIPKDELFPGTQTDHAPHWFNCRCYTDYSIVNPESLELD